MKNSEMLTKLFFKLLPVQIAIVAMSAVNSLIDGAIAGRFIDATTVGVVGMYFAMINVFSAISNTLLGGTSVLCERSRGKGGMKRASSIFSLNMTVTTVISLVLTLVSLLAPVQTAGLLGANGALVAPLSDYVRGYAIGILPMLLSQQVASFLQLERQSKRGYAGIAGMIISNIVLDLVLVAWFRMGIWGLALATSLSNWVYLAILLPYYFSDRAQLRFDIKSIVWKDLVPMITIGAPGAMLVFCLAIRAVLINRLLLTCSGTAGLAASSSFEMVKGFFIAVALGAGAVIRMLSSVAYGEGDRDSLARILRIGFCRVVPVSLTVTAAALLLSSAVPALFFPDRASEEFMLSRQLFIVYSFCIPLIVLCQIFTSYLQSTGHMAYVNLVSVFDGLLSMTIPAYLLAPAMGAMGVWLANPIGIILTLLLTLIYAIVYNRGIPKTRDEWLLLPPDFGVSDEDRLDITVYGLDDVVTTAERVQSFCEEHGFDGKKSKYAALCLEEMADNVVEHGFTKDGKKHMADIRVVFENDEVMLRIKDDCIPYDPMERAGLLSDDDITHNIGLRMVMRLSDDISYYNMMGLNVLTIYLR